MISREMVEKIAMEIRDMQEIVDDKGAGPEMRSNARSYIRGMKKAMAILSGEEDKED